jgi:tRNA modification GTPase
LKILAQRLRQAAGRLTIMQKLLHPPEVVLAGPPNAGKSTLANALVARPVSIVHAMAGTTRDWIREQAVIDGRAVWLTDTAGLWDVDHAVDAEAVRRAWDRIDSADLVLLCNPADAPPENSASNTMHALPLPRDIHAPTLAVTTKADLLSNGARRSTRSAATTREAAGATPRPDQNRNDNDPSIHNSELITHNLSVSAETGEGLPALRTAILEKLGLADIDPAAPAAFTQRQADLLNHAADALDIENHEIVISSLSQVLF